MSVTVLIPVGPGYNRVWLQEAVNSALAQPIDEIVVVDDGAAVDLSFLQGFVQNKAPLYEYWYRSTDDVFPKLVIKVLKLPANVGFTAAFNLGMGYATNDLVVYLAADDKLMPQAVEKAVQTWEKNNQKDAWYSFTYIDSTGKKSEIPINAAMITKGLWRKVGGYPPAAFVGPDAAVLSCLIAHAPDRIIHVDPGNPLYWIRDHADQETKTHTWRFVDEMTSIRNKLTRDFKMRD